MHELRVDNGDVCRHSVLEIDRYQESTFETSFLEHFGSLLVLLFRSPGIQVSI